MATLHSLGLGACFSIEAEHNGHRRVLCDWQPNLITDAGMMSIGGAGPAGIMAVGNATGAPAIDDTVLFNEIAATTTAPAVQTGNLKQAPWYRFMRLTWTFAAGAVNGALTELGIRGGALYTHALIKNRLGEPIAVQVYPDETLVVRYEFRFYLLDTADQSPQMNINGQSTAVTLRYADIDASNGYLFDANAGNLSGEASAVLIYDADATLGPIDENPRGGTQQQVNTGAPVISDVVNDNGVFSQPYTYSIGPAQANNFPPIAFIASANPGQSRFAGFQIQLDPPVQKTFKHGLDIKLALSWQRVDI